MLYQENGKIKCVNLVLVVDAVACHGAGHSKSRPTKESSSNAEPEHFLGHPLLLWLPLANAPSKVGAPAGPVARGLRNIFFGGLGFSPPYNRTASYCCQTDSFQSFSSVWRMTGIGLSRICANVLTCDGAYGRGHLLGLKACLILLANPPPAPPATPPNAPPAKPAPAMLGQKSISIASFSFSLSQTRPRRGRGRRSKA